MPVFTVLAIDYEHCASQLTPWQKYNGMELYGYYVVTFFTPCRQSFGVIPTSAVPSFKSQFNRETVQPITPCVQIL